MTGNIFNSYQLSNDVTATAASNDEYLINTKAFTLKKHAISTTLPLLIWGLQLIMNALGRKLIFSGVRIQHKNGIAE